MLAPAGAHALEEGVDDATRAEHELVSGLIGVDVAVAMGVADAGAEGGELVDRVEGVGRGVLGGAGKGEGARAVEEGGATGWRTTNFWVENFLEPQKSVRAPGRAARIAQGVLCKLTKSLANRLGAYKASSIGQPHESDAARVHARILLARGDADESIASFVMAAECEHARQADGIFQAAAWSLGALMKEHPPLQATCEAIFEAQDLTPNERCALAITLQRVDPERWKVTIDPATSVATITRPPAASSPELVRPAPLASPASPLRAAGWRPTSLSMNVRSERIARVAARR